MMNSCLFSVSYAGFWGQAVLSLEDLIKRAGGLGYSSVMLMGKRPHLSPLDTSPERIAILKAALQASGLRCDVLAAYTDIFPNGPSGVPFTEMQIAHVESLARIGTGLGVKVVRIFSAYDSDHRDIQASWQHVVVAIREMCDRVAAHGLTIAIQNHHDTVLDTDSLLGLLGEIDRPNCKLGFDAWSPALRGEDLYESARKAAPHTAITTTADYAKVPRFRYNPALVNYERQPLDWVRAVTFGTGFTVTGGGSIENLDRKARGYLEWMAARRLIPAQ